jgi:protein-S-isoprenylcysteine O-methyltransferase Ste14
MHAVRLAVAAVWLAFGVYWFARARGVKAGTRTLHFGRARVGVWIVAIVAIRVFHPRSLTVDDPVVAGIGIALLGCGLAIAIWARAHLGRNWGMPMTVKQEPELVTSGPYRFVRHPIYSGLLLALVGTALATSLLVLVLVATFGVTFYISARIEEQNMTRAFPAAYPAYRARTKMLVPLLL